MNRAGFIAVAAFFAALVVASDALGRSLQLRAPQVSMLLPTAKGSDYSAAASKSLALGLNDGLSGRLKLDDLQKSRIAALSRTALRSEPLDAPALRNLGFIAQDAGRSSQARQFMLASAELTRRDLGTNMWLALDYSRLGRIDRALTMYDQGLRTNRRAQELVIPAMALALKDDRMVPEVARLLRTRPPWLNDFWASAPRFTDALPNLGRVRLDLAAQGVPVPRESDRELVAAFASAGLYDSANNLLRSLGENRELEKSALRNGEFEQVPEFIPFDWQPQFGASLNTDLDPRAGTLRVSVFGDGSGLAARQLVALPGSKWRLAVVARDWRDAQRGQVYFKVSCAEPGLNGESAPIRLESASFSTVLAKPVKGCVHHWLSVFAAPSSRQGETSVTLDRISLVPA